MSTTSSDEAPPEAVFQLSETELTVTPNLLSQETTVTVTVDVRNDYHE